MGDTTTVAVAVGTVVSVASGVALGRGVRVGWRVAVAVAVAVVIVALRIEYVGDADCWWHCWTFFAWAAWLNASLEQPA